MDAVHFTTPTYFSYDILASRIPIPLPYFGNLIRPLPDTVWALVFLMVFAMSLVFMFISKIYARIDRDLNHFKGERLTQEGFSLVDYPVKTFSTLTEPELIPWFPSWSAGKFTVQYPTRHI